MHLLPLVRVTSSKTSKSKEPLGKDLTLFPRVDPSIFPPAGKNQSEGRRCARAKMAPSGLGLGTSTLVPLAQFALLRAL